MGNSSRNAAHNCYCKDTVKLLLTLVFLWKYCRIYLFGAPLRVLVVVLVFNNLVILSGLNQFWRAPWSNLPRSMPGMDLTAKMIRIKTIFGLPSTSFHASTSKIFALVNRGCKRWLFIIGINQVIRSSWCFGIALAMSHEINSGSQKKGLFLGIGQMVLLRCQITYHYIPPRKLFYVSFNQYSEECLGLVLVLASAVHVRWWYPWFVDLSTFEMGRLRELDTHQIGKLLSVSGVVTRTSEVRPELLSGNFRCLDCGAVIKDVQQQFKYTQVPIYFTCYAP